MAYDGNGRYNLPTPQYPAISGSTIFAEDFNTIVSDIAQALSNALPRDGEAAMTGALDLGGNGLKNVATIAALATGLLISGAVTFNGAVQFTGHALAVTQPAGTNTADLATCAFVLQTAMNAALPAQAGNAGKTLVTDGFNATWQPSTMFSNLTLLAQAQATALCF